MHHKILTVDDSRTVRIIVRKAFGPYDCSVLEAANGAEGLACAAKESPSLILVDVTMPVMDGLDMLAGLKADPALANIPVIMLTAEGAQEQVRRATELGARDYIVKPFKDAQLIERVSRVLHLAPAVSIPLAVPA